MTAKISANFNSRSMADRAVSRLRSYGIDFSVAHVRARDGGQLGFGNDYGPGAVNLSGATNDLAFPISGFWDAANTDAIGAGTPTFLSLNVRSQQLESARRCLRSAGGLDIRIGV